MAATCHFPLAGCTMLGDIWRPSPAARPMHWIRGPSCALIIHFCCARSLRYCKLSPMGGKRYTGRVGMNQPKKKKVMIEAVTAELGGDDRSPPSSTPSLTEQSDDQEVPCRTALAVRCSTRTHCHFAACVGVAAGSQPAATLLCRVLCSAHTRVSASPAHTSRCRAWPPHRVHGLASRAVYTHWAGHTERLLQMPVGTAQYAL
jgi:hypothetical protein